MTVLNLKSLIKEDNLIKIDYPDLEGFELSLGYLSRAEMLKIRKKCTVTKINKKTRQPEENLDEDKFTEAYIESVIKGWKGLKVSYLSELVPIDTTGVDTNEELPYTQENAKELMKNSTYFETWIGEVVGDVTNFNKDS